MKSNLTFLRDAEVKDKWDLPSLFNAVRKDVIELAKGYMQTFGSEGKAW